MSAGEIVRPVIDIVRTTGSCNERKVGVKAQMQEKIVHIPSWERRNELREIATVICKAFLCGRIGVSVAYSMVAGRGSERHSSSA